MAVETVAPQFLEQQEAAVVRNSEFVTVVAVEWEVSSGQRKSGPLVIEGAFGEGMNGMAKGAVGLEMVGGGSPPRAIMHVAVTPPTFVRDGPVADRRAPSGGEETLLFVVALLAGQTDVLSRESVAGVAIVIEEQVLRIEAGDDVAAIAGLLELLVVIVLVAGAAMDLQWPVNDGAADTSREE